MQSYGGRIADDEGKNVTIKSEATRDYLTWVKNAWDKGSLPARRGVVGRRCDNQAYLSGQAAFIANTGSVAMAAIDQDPELYEATGYSPLPAGPVMQVNPLILYFRAIPESSQNKAAAQALIEHLAQPEFANKYFQSAIYGPALKGHKALPAFDGSDPIKAGLLDLVENGTAPAYPDLYNAAYAEVSTNFLIPKMVQRVVVDGWDFDRAMDEAQAQAEAIYAKY